MDLKKRKIFLKIRINLHAHTAADVDDLTADIRGEVAGEEEGSIGHIFWSSGSSERNLLLPFCAHLFGDFCGHFGLDEARRDTIGTNVTGTHFLGDGLGESDEAGLGGGVIALACISSYADNG